MSSENIETQKLLQNELEKIANHLIENKPVKTLDEALNRKYKFWDTQPVSKLTDIVMNDQAIEDDQEVKKNPIKLPKDCEWVIFDVSKGGDAKEIETFLNKHNFENIESGFTQNYSVNFLQWLLVLPDSSNICIGVRVTSSKLLVGLIGGKVVKTQVNKNALDTLEVNFLCVHSKLRGKRLSTSLIKEMKRQANSLGVYQGTYSTDKYLPKPFCNVENFYRPLNISPLIESGFAVQPDNTTLKDMKKALKLPETPQNKNFIKMQEKHVTQAFNKLNLYFAKYNHHPIFTGDQFKHIFYNNDFVSSYVIEEDDGDVCDFVSYLKVKSRSLKNKEKYKFIRKGCLYYYTSTAETSYRLINDILIVAKNEGMDVFNALNIMENKHILKELRFESGSSGTNYYLYNWKTKDMNPSQICKIFI